MLSDKLNSIKDSILSFQAAAGDAVSGSTTEGVGATAAAAAGGPVSSNLIMLGAIGLVFYFIVFRPQQKKIKEHNEMIAGLAIGSTVLISNSIMGVLVKKNEEKRLFTVEIAPGVRVDVIQSCVSKVVTAESEKAKGDKKEKKSRKKQDHDLQPVVATTAAADVTTAATAVRGGRTSKKK